MKEYFVITDPHSFFSFMMDALERAGFDKDNPGHIIIGCGDYMDRGPESYEMCDFLYNMMKQNRAILIRGNHEDLFNELVTKRWPDSYDYSNGTVKTVCEMKKHPVYEMDYLDNPDEYSATYDHRWDDVLRSMLNYYETERYVFVHGWIPIKEFNAGKFVYDPEWRDANSISWKDARWINGINAAFQGTIIPDKTIICGHWNCSYGRVREKVGEKAWASMSNKKRHMLEFGKNITDENEYLDLFSPYYRKGLLALDACTAVSGFCNCIHFTEDELGKEIARG